VIDDPAAAERNVLANKLKTRPMSASDAQPAPVKEFAIPLDLSTWADKPLLLQWVVEEIDSLDWSNPELVQILHANPKFKPRFLLVVMVYAYATGRFDSEEVTEVYFTEPVLQHLFPEHALSPNTVMRFRRDYRGLLRWGLAQVLRRSLRHHYDLGDAAIPAGLNRLIVQAATVRLDAARHFDRSNVGE
jgi:hypothetical protein